MPPPWTEHDLTRHRALIDACLRHGVAFWWRSPGTLLIDGTGVRAVLLDVVAQGYKVLGFEGFDLESRYILPRLDLIFDAERWPDDVDLSAVLSTWPEEAWVDVTLAKGG